VHIPAAFARAMAEVYGAAGVAWLQRLPAIIDACARRWALTVGPPFEPLTYNWVAPAERAGDGYAVLKVGFPSRELLSETDALQRFDGRGVAQLLAFDRDGGAMLLERLLPGTPLSALGDDDAATGIAAAVMRDLWRPAPTNHTFPTVADWGQGFARMRAHFSGGTGPLPPPLVARAESLFADLLDSAAPAVLLHGDLHHDNILAAERRPWLAIDPKGLIGEPAYEVGALLRNPMPWLLDQPNPGRVLARRLRTLSEALAIDEQRLRDWGLAQAVLSAWWSIEDHGHGWEPAIACAELLAALPSR
jgi:streptomycin 6-kinase